MKSTHLLDRKSTITSSVLSENNPRKSMKSHCNRISSLKNISFETQSFSHHIYQEGKSQTSKMNDSLYSQGSQSPEKAIVEQNVENTLTKSCKQQGKNPFVQACMNSKNKLKAKKNDILMERFGANQQQQQESNEITTFRMIKKGKYQVGEGECHDTL